jgi:excisionase family DNA binding protein
METSPEHIEKSDHELLTPTEAAERLRVHPEQVRNLIRRGQIEAVNVGTGPKRPLYRIPPKAIDTFLSRRWQPGKAVEKTQTKRRKLSPVQDFFPTIK